jgi:hypothetical protein
VGIGVLIFILIFVFVFWNMGRARNSSSDSFDLALFSLLFAFLMSRGLAIINNYEYYFNGAGSIINVFDKNYLYSGIFLGLLISTYILFKWGNKEKDFYAFQEKVVVSYSFAIIPLLLVALFAGKMLGLVVQGDLALDYTNGLSRMPLNLFRITYNVLFLAIWIVIGRQTKRRGLFGLIFIMIFGGIEFMLRFFSNGYNPSVTNTMDISQLSELIAMMIGLLLLLNYYNFKIFNLQSKHENRPKLTRQHFSNEQGIRGQHIDFTQKDRFSLSYNSIQDSVNDNELNIKEKFRIWWNTFKRRFKK